MSKNKIVTGIVDRNKKGFGFVIPFENNLKDIYIPPNNMNGIFDGDTVKVLIRKKGNNEFSDRGVITEVVNRANKFILGRIIKLNKVFLFQPLSHKICNDLPVSQKKSKFDINNIFQKKMIVKCEISNWKKKPTANIIKILKNETSKNFQEELLKTKFNFKTKFPTFVNKETAKMEFLFHKSDLEKRVDHSNLLTITIDPETAKDFDDAISLEIKNNINILYVHIADVSYYIQPGSFLDKEAFERGTSIYLIDKVIPMLPEKLSNELCSLRQNEDKLTMTVKAEFDLKGKLIKYKVYESLIKVDKRFSYKEIDTIIDNNYESNNIDTKIIDMLKSMIKLSQLFRKNRFKNGGIDFDLPEPVFELDGQGHVTNTILENRTVSHELVEEFMLTANEITAEYLNSNKIPVLYRTHEKPDTSKLQKLALSLENYGFKYKSTPNSFDLQKVIKKIKDREEERFLTTLILRSMQQAKYSPDNIGHYGLAKKNYLHFTSPIRRYPDIIVHRSLKALINNNTKMYKTKEYKKELFDIGNQLSKKERIAVDAERKSIRLRLMQYMFNKKGQVFNAFITGMTAEGIYAELENMLEGFVMFAGKQKSNYIIDTANYELRTSNKTYKLGQKIKVKIINIDILNDKVDFELAEQL